MKNGPTDHAAIVGFVEDGVNWIVQRRMTAITKPLWSVTALRADARPLGDR
jgi:hypothetical protein